MFRKFAIFFFATLLSFKVNAQNFEGGTILGLSSSQVGGDNLAGFKKAGLLAGVFASRKIATIYSIKIEMLYIQKGSNNPEINNSEHHNAGIPDISLSYVEIPVFIQYHQNYNLQIEAGIYGSYLIEGYYNDAMGKMSNTKNPFINYDTGLLLGINYHYSENISLNTRVSNSILPIGAENYDGINSYNYLTKGKYNSVLSFALNYNF